MAFSVVFNPLQYIGSSSDIKPSKVAIGSTFFEADTNEWFTFTDAGWLNTPNNQYKCLNEIHNELVKLNDGMDRLLLFVQLNYGVEV